MLNVNGQRELAYVVLIDEIMPIEGYDRVELARVGGWHVIVQKGQFKVGDPAVYFEVDSRVPSDRECFAFLAKRKYKIKTIKMCDVVSQGLLMHANDFGWEVRFNHGLYILKNHEEFISNDPFILDNNGVEHHYSNESRFLTEILGVVHIEDEDNAKSASVDKYKTMAQRRPNIFKKKWARWLMKREWGRKLMFALFGRKKKKSETAFPTKFPFVKRTDEERVENMPWVLKDKTPYIVTQKCDGSSATYILARTHNPFHPFEFYVCSRNVRMLRPDQKCFYDENVYWQMAEKYGIEQKLKNILNGNHKLSYVCWQGEICGPHIQKNSHHLKENHLFCFHMIDSVKGKYDMRDAEKYWIAYGMEMVPIVDIGFRMPDDFEEFKAMATGFYSTEVTEGTPECPREGYVYYKTTDPNFSFKSVSNEYLLNH